MTGVLYIVATPIGNLDDISLRAIEILKQVDVIAAEDTRHSIRLLNHLGIRNKLMSLHEHNERDRIDGIIDDLKQGNNIALISDAGTPLISDPGYPLVKAVQDAGLRVSPIPGASSIIAALCAAGMPTDPFTFYGFLSQKNSERLSKLSALKQQQGTLVFLESTHRIERLLEQLSELYGDNRIVVAKELTKAFER
ncbi:MAG: 16S rRNA (cytidine1402-2'-O)-methyltransferase, partial [Chitinophagales bacterium]